MIVPGGEQPRPPADKRVHVGEQLHGRELVEDSTAQVDHRLEAREPPDQRRLRPHPPDPQATPDQLAERPHGDQFVRLRRESRLRYESSVRFGEAQLGEHVVDDQRDPVTQRRGDDLLALGGRHGAAGRVVTASNQIGHGRPAGERRAVRANVGLDRQQGRGRFAEDLQRPGVGRRLHQHLGAGRDKRPGQQREPLLPARGDQNLRGRRGHAPRGVPGGQRGP